MITKLQLDQIRARCANCLDTVRPLRWYTDARDGLCPDAPKPKTLDYRDIDSAYTRGYRDGYRHGIRENDCISGQSGYGGGGGISGR
jgi:hypothetical protein